MLIKSQIIKCLCKAWSKKPNEMLVERIDNVNVDF